MRFPELLDVLPVIPMERPFKLFGRSFALRMSSHLTLEPNTLLRVLLGETFQQAAKAHGSDVFTLCGRWRQPAFSDGHDHFSPSPGVSKLSEDLGEPELTDSPVAGATPGTRLGSPQKEQPPGTGVAETAV